MANNDNQLHTAIRQTLAGRPGALVDVSVELWVQLEAELSALIGDGGFQALFARSVHAVGAAYPWLTAETRLWSGTGDFSGLRRCLEQREQEEAKLACIALFTTFIDILIVLIGELLTTSILRSAWGDDAADIAGKEFQS